MTLKPPRYFPDAAGHYKMLGIAGTSEVKNLMTTGPACRMAAGVILLILMATSPSQTAPIEGKKALLEYAGVYQWGPSAFVYLQLWAEFTGKQQLVAFDESGDVRVLSPTDHDHFFHRNQRRGSVAR